MKKTFVIARVGNSQYVTLRTHAHGAPGQTGLMKAIDRFDNGGVVNVAVKPGQQRKLSRETAKLIGSMLADPVTESKLTKANELIQMAKDAAESPITARFRRAVA
jgi:hypothetical protein